MAAGESVDELLEKLRLSPQKSSGHTTRDVSNSDYHYQPLNPLLNEFRLLKIHPGQPHEEISCTIDHHAFTDKSEYHALSYTWGDRGSTCPIILNGQSFQITTSLETALRHIRPLQQPRVIWVDALCINQQDPEERGHQVRRMHEIYSSASSVITWLGASEDDSDIAMDFLQEIEQGQGLFDADGEPLAPRQKWLALRKLWARPYWGRVWIIQELAAAMIREESMFIPRYRAQVCCGRKWLALDKFQNACHYLNKYLSHPLVRGDGEYVPVLNLFRLLFEYAHGRLTLMDLISLTYAANATDPRDHFFAVLGLAPEIDRTYLVPDYTKPFREVCAEFFKYIIRTEKKLEMLAFDHFGCLPHLPTWAPNLTSMSRDTRNNWQPYRQNFQAAGKAKLDPCSTTFSDDLTTLTVAGFNVDTVASVDGPFTDIEGFLRDFNNNPKVTLLDRFTAVDYQTGRGMGYFPNLDPPPVDEPTVSMDIEMQNKLSSILMEEVFGGEKGEAETSLPVVESGAAMHVSDLSDVSTAPSVPSTQQSAFQPMQKYEAIQKVHELRTIGLQFYARRHLKDILDQWLIPRFNLEVVPLIMQRSERLLDDDSIKLYQGIEKLMKHELDVLFFSWVQGRGERGEEFEDLFNAEFAKPHEKRFGDDFEQLLEYCFKRKWMSECENLLRDILYQSQEWIETLLETWIEGEVNQLIRHKVQSRMDPKFNQSELEQISFIYLAERPSKEYGPSRRLKIALLFKHQDDFRQELGKELEQRFEEYLQQRFPEERFPVAKTLCRYHLEEDFKERLMVRARDYESELSTALEHYLKQLWDREFQKQLEKRIERRRTSLERYEESALIAVGKTLVLDHHLEESPPIAKPGIPDLFHLFFQKQLDPMNRLSRTGDRSNRQPRPGIDGLVSVVQNDAGAKRCFELSVRQALEGRCFFTTTSGYIGLGPRGMLCGDYVAIFRGANMPFVIRDRGTHHSLIGEAYVHGIMHGELMSSSYSLREFHLK